MSIRVSNQWAYPFSLVNQPSAVNVATGQPNPELTLAFSAQPHIPSQWLQLPALD